MKLDNVADIYPLSPLQEGMLFETLYAPGSGLYCEQFTYAIKGRLDAAALKRAWQRVIMHHPALRSAFFWQGLEKPLQVVRQEVALPWRQEDWSGLDPERQEERLRAFLLADQGAGFDLDQAPLMRLALLRTGPQSHWLVWTHHHILMDGWCMPIILRDLAACHAQETGGPAARLASTRPFRDYIKWLGRQSPQQAGRFWAGHLEGLQDATLPPFAKGPAKTHGADHARLAHQLSEEQSLALRELARGNRLTLGAIFQGAWALLLSRYCGNREVVFGATVSGRPPELEGVEDMVGLFINTLPVRASVSPGDKLLPWLAGLQKAQRQREQFAHSSLVEIQKYSSMAAGQALFHNLLVFENYPAEHPGGQIAPGLEITTRHIFEKVNYPLTLIASPGARVTMRLYHDLAVVSSGQARKLVSQLCNLLGQMAAKPGARLGELDMLGEQVQAELLSLGRSEPTAPAPSTMLDLFWQRVEHSPDSPALRHGDQVQSYAQLAGQALALAGRLRELGAGPGQVVGICLPRSLEMAVSLLGAALSGAAYLPLDPAYPTERCREMLRQGGPRLLLTNRALAAAMDSGPECQVLLAEELPPWQGGQIQRPAWGPGGQDACYLLFTSGSTGRPKGVVMEHASLANLIAWQVREQAGDRAPDTLQFAPLSFDVSFQEFFATWCGGGCLHLLDEETRLDPNALLRLISEQGIGRLFLPFVALRQLALAAQNSALPAGLGEVITAGEQLRMDQELRDFFAALPACRLVNQYGPTETHVVTSHRLQGSPRDWPALPPIGRPIANCAILLVAPDGSLTPPQGVGELWLGGLPVARGYLGREDPTRERFVTSPHAPGRFYRSGDLGRWRADGQLEFLGRSDSQVKIRGFRVEPAEVETRLSAHPMVTQAAVVVRPDSGGFPSLAAYVALSSGMVADQALRDLRPHLAQSLPEYMLPASITVLESLPLTPSGKIDRRALPDPRPSQAAPAMPPQGRLEETVAGLFRQVLGLELVNRDDDFFTLGGHSLLATQLMGRLNREFGLELPIKTLFEHPTCLALARAVKAAFSPAPPERDGDRERFTL